MAPTLNKVVNSAGQSPSFGQWQSTLKMMMSSISQSASKWQVQGEKSAATTVAEEKSGDSNYAITMFWLLFGISCFFTIILTWFALPVAIIFLILACGEHARREEHELKRQASQGNISAMYDLACKKQKQGKLEESVDYYWQAAEKEHAESQYQLGLAYKSGTGIEKDTVRAISWLEKAAEQGHVKAQYTLGMLYKNGEGIEKNISQALHWFEMAASQDHAEAQFEIGLAHLIGDEIGENRVYAMNMFKKALDNGSSRAEIVLGFRELKNIENVSLQHDSDLIKQFGIELVKKGYYLQFCYVAKLPYGTYEVKVTVYHQDKQIGTMKLGTYSAGDTGLISHRLKMKYYESHKKEADKLLTHLIYLDQVGILIESNVYRLDPPPEWLMICAAVLEKGPLVDMHRPDAGGIVLCKSILERMSEADILEMLEYVNAVFLVNRYVYDYQKQCLVLKNTNYH